MNKAYVIVGCILVAIGILLGGFGVFMSLQTQKQMTLMSRQLAAELAAANPADKRVDNTKLDALTGQTGEIQKTIDTLKSRSVRIADLEVKADRIEKELTTLKTHGTATTDLAELNNKLTVVVGSLSDLRRQVEDIEISTRASQQRLLTQQARPELQGDKFRFSLRANEWAAFKGVFNGIQNTVEVADAPTTEALEAEINATYRALKTRDSIDDFKREWVRLSKLGLDVHLLLSQPAPLERTLWIEVYAGDTFYIIHPELDLATWSKITSRKDVPALLRDAEFGLFYARAENDTKNADGKVVHTAKAVGYQLLEKAP